jgi:uncharacterized membrane protein YfcA
MTLFLVAVASFIAAAVNSIAGGGTFLTFPTLTRGALLSEKVANMTSTVGLWPGSASAIYAARKDFAQIARSLFIPYIAISTAGAIVGSILLRFYTSQTSFKLMIPWLLLFATVIFAASKPIAQWSARKHGGRSTFWIVAIGCLQFIIAIYGGFFGAGVGVLTMAGLSLSGIDNVHQMNALKVLLVTIINAIASIVFVIGSFGAVGDNRIDWTIAGLMAVISVVAGFIGMGVARKIPPMVLRAIILGVAAALTVYYFIDSYRLTERFGG